MTGFLERIFKSRLGVLLTIAGLVLSAYAFMLASPFKTMDDDFSIVKNTEIRSLREIPHFFQTTYFKSERDYYRPMVYVTYAFEYHFFGLNPFHYNLDNILLHILNAWLVFVLAGLLLRERALAAAVALLFAIHPVHWEAVGNISGRAILLCGFFVLAGAVFFLKFRREKKAGFLWAAAACYILGLMSKESAGVLILTITALVGLVDRPRGPKTLADWAWAIPFSAIAAAYLYLRHVMGIAQMYPWPSKSAMALGLTTFLKGIFIYVGIFMMPVDLRFDRALPIFHSFLDPQSWLILVAWAVIVGLVWTFRRELRGVPLFCLAWFLIELLPVSQIVTTIGVYPGAISLAEHFVYVASVPALILMTLASRALLNRAVERKVVSAGFTQWACAGVFLFFFIMLIQQNIYASNEFVMMRDSLAKHPQNARLQYSLGMIYAKARNFDKAVEHFGGAVRSEPDNPSYRIALGKALTDQGSLIAAAREYESVLPSKKPNKLLEDNKLAVYRLLATDYEKKIAMEPNDARKHFALGIFSAKLGDQKRALAEYRRAVELKPDYFDALFNIAVTSEMTGDPESAVAAYARLVDAASAENPFRSQAREALKRLQGR